MKTLLRIFAFLAISAAAHAAAWDLSMVQFDALNKPRTTTIAPAANSLLGFSETKGLVNVTAGTGITITGNVISSTGGGNVTNNATLASGNLVIGGGTSVIGTTNITVTGGNTLGVGTVNADTLNISTITGVVAAANGGTGLSSPGTSGNVLTSNGTGWTSSAPTGGSGAVTGDTKFILDTATVASGWSLTGVNGIAPFSTPDIDYKAVMKVAGTVATPTFSPAAGAVANGAPITFLSSTPGVSFRSRTDGTDPTRDTGTAGSTVNFPGTTTTYEVIAYGTDTATPYIDSVVASATYTLAGGGGSFLYNEGFEGTGTPSGWYTDGDPDSTDSPLVPSQSLRLAAIKFAQYLNGGALNHTTVGFKFRFKPAALPATFSKIFSGMNSSSSTIFSISLFSDGRIGHDWSLDKTVATMTAGTTYDVWVYYNTTSGSLSVAFDTAGSARPTSGNNYLGITDSPTAAVAQAQYGDPGSSISADYDSAQADVTHIP